MHGLFFLLVASSFASEAHKFFSFQALFLVNICRVSTLLKCDLEKSVLEAATKLRVIAVHQGGLNVKRALHVAEDEYVRYLKKVRMDHVGRSNLGMMVEARTMNNATNYKLNIDPVDLAEYQPVAHLFPMLNIPPEVLRGDPVLQEMRKGALTALEAFASTHRDYEEYSLLPFFDASTTLSGYLIQLSMFIDTTMGKYDFAATYPDSIMCISLLQFFRYMALMAHDVNIVRSIGGLYLDAIVALKRMEFVPIESASLILLRGKIDLILCRMPHVRAGREPMQVSIFKMPNVLLVSGLHVKNMDEASDLVMELYQQNKLPTSMLR